MAISPGNFSPSHLHSRTLSRGEHVFLVGDKRKYVYFVRTGSIKSCLTSTAGDEHVVSFHLPGEHLGLNAALGEGGVHKSLAIALEDTEVCAIPAVHLVRFVEHTPGGVRWLLGLAGEEISHCYLKQLTLNKMNAETRLGHFLLDLSKRFHVRGCSAKEFNLSMSREDIANHLGMALETVSRLLTRFQQDGLLEVNHRRWITIRDAASLAARQTRIVA
jgi:CRP/FNR family transcriptional regulator